MLTRLSPAGGDDARGESDVIEYIILAFVGFILLRLAIWHISDCIKAGFRRRSNE